MTELLNIKIGDVYYFQKRAGRNLKVYWYKLYNNKSHVYVGHAFEQHALDWLRQREKFLQNKVKSYDFSLLILNLQHGNIVDLHDFELIKERNELLLELQNINVVLQTQSGLKPRQSKY